MFNNMENNYNITLCKKHVKLNLYKDQAAPFKKKNTVIICVKLQQ